jgi:hypothetical protein
LFTARKKQGRMIKNVFLKRHVPMSKENSKLECGGGKLKYGSRRLTCEATGAEAIDAISSAVRADLYARAVVKALLGLTVAWLAVRGSIEPLAAAWRYIVGFVI